MIATTWVQIIKAILLLFGATLISVLVMWKFNFNLNTFFDTAINYHRLSEQIIAPGALIKDPISAISLGLALMFGTAGLPHILMRFFTVKIPFRQEDLLPLQPVLLVTSIFLHLSSALEQ